MKTSTPDTLSTLLHTLNDGIAIYIAASAKVEPDHYKIAFADMIESRKFALAYLQPYALPESHPLESSHNFGNLLHRAYSKIVESGPNNLSGVLEQLVLIENETLKHMQAVLLKTNNIMVLSVIKQLLPRMEAAKGRLSALRVSLAA